MLILALICPTAGALLLGLLKPKVETARRLAVLIALATSVIALIMAWRGVPELTLLSYGDNYALRLGLDHRGKLFIALMALLWPLATLYATEYMAHEERETTFYMWYLLSYSVMLPFCCARNLFTLYVFYELLTLVTLPLVWHNKDHDSVRAARAYVRYAIGCAAFGFVAVIVLGHHGTLDFAAGGHVYPGLPVQLKRAVFVSAFFGFGVKAAIFPFGAWLPKASVAPTPVTALLHAVAVVNAGVFAVQRVAFDMFSTAALVGSWAQHLMLFISAFTVVFGATMALRERHAKRRLAYSTVSNLGYMLLGAALMSPEGDAGSMMHMIVHSVTKIVLFFCVGAVTVQTGRTRVAEMRGLGRRMPLTFSAFLIASLSLMGIPPLAGFVSKVELLEASIDLGGLWGTLGAATLMLSSILTGAYTLSIALPAWFLPQDGAPAAEGRCDPTWRMLIPIFVILSVMLAIGLYPAPVLAAMRGLGEL